MEHPEAQVPPLQTSPDGQAAAPVTIVQVVVLVPGVQTSQPSLVVEADA
jgi:hypothetical protein